MAQSSGDAPNPLRAGWVHVQCADFPNLTGNRITPGLEWLTDLNPISIGVVAVNVIQFIRVNVFYGHDKGDEVIEALEAAMTDAFPRSALLHFGPERFAVVRQAVSASDVALARNVVMARLERIMAEPVPVQVSGINLDTSASPSASATLAGLVAAANHALDRRMGSETPITVVT